MFFYMVFFKKLVYAPKISVLIFIWLILLCLATSYLINFIYKPILKIFRYRIFRNVNNLNKKITAKNIT